MKELFMFSLMIGCYIGLAISFFYQVSVITGTSMSVDGGYKTCYAFVYRTKDISGRANELVCFNVNWMDGKVCHRCEDIRKFGLKYDYRCWGDNPKSTIDYIRKSDIEGVVALEVCV